MQTILLIMKIIHCIVCTRHSKQLCQVLLTTLFASLLSDHSANVFFVLPNICGFDFQAPEKMSYDFLLDSDAADRSGERTAPRSSGYAGAAYGSNQTRRRGSFDKEEARAHGSESSGMKERSGFGTPASPFHGVTRSTGKPPRTSVLSSGRRGAPDLSPRGTMSTPGRNVRFAEGGNISDPMSTRSSQPVTPFSSGKAFTPTSGGGVRTTPFSVNSMDRSADTMGSAQETFAGSTPYAGRGRHAWGQDSTPGSGSAADPYALLNMSQNGSNGNDISFDPLRSSGTGGYSALSPVPAAGANQALQNLEEVYRVWCIVIGIFPDNSRRDKIMGIFNVRESVQSVKESSGNWVLVKFTSAQEAARAVAVHNGSFVNSGTMLAVSQLTTSAANHMNLRLNVDGDFVGGAGGITDGTTFLDSSENDQDAQGRGRNAAEATSLRHRAPERTSVSPNRHTSGLKITTVNGSEVDPSLYLRPVRRQSVCDAVMRWFGYR